MPRTGHDVLEYEIRQEQAATIGRLARELQDALDALRSFAATRAARYVYLDLLREVAPERVKLEAVQ